MHDPKTDREFTSWNEEMVRRYDIDRYYEKSHPLVRWIEARRIESLFDLAAPRGGDRVLEVGCGAGHVLARFDGHERVGLDLSETMLGRARKRLGENVRLLRGSAEQLPFETGSFAVVLCTEVLEHTQHPAVVIRELMRVAAPAGRVVVSIPNEGNIDRAKRVLRALPLVNRLLGTLADEGNEWHVHRFDKRLLHEVTRGVAGIVRMRGVPFPAMPLRYVALLNHQDHR
jgi:ubiquinone/menaquinone biosynthesis C-methylase UbiE